MNDERERFERVAACPACGGAGFRPWRKGSADLRELRPEDVRITDSRYGLTWDLSRCDDCGHIFADPCPTPAFIGSLYGALEDPLYEEEAEGRAMNFRRVLTRIEGLRPEKGRLFDVGAATGILMNLARERGWEIDGVEPSAWAVAFARDRYGLAVREGVFETATVSPVSVDVVTMVDLIEHTARPYDVVHRAAEVLRPGGLLCLVTPDIRSAAARLSGRTWWHLRPAHLAYFTRGSLDALFSRTGFTVVRRRSYSWTFSARYLASRKAALRFLLRGRRLSSYLGRIPIKLALGDSFEIYARKKGAD
jgi:SAM-dependent methyltransferase